MKKALTSLGLCAAVIFVTYVLIGGELPFEGSVSNQEAIQLEKQLVLLKTNQGNIKIELYPKKSPISVTNFISYIKSGFYNDTIFHRVLPGTIVQGGGFTDEMVLKLTRPPIVNESDNGLTNIKGTVSMGRKSSPDSATSQFFINLKDNSKLDYSIGEQGYSVFGRVVEGLDLLEAVSRSETIEVGAHKNVPIPTLKLISAKLINKKPETKYLVEQAETTEPDSEPFKEGIHYVLLNAPKPLLNTNKVEVVAAFSFGCGHCYGIYPATQEWNSENRHKVEFRYFHAVWSKAMRLYAQTYYTAIELQIEHLIHLPLFEAIVINQQKLSNKEELAHFFQSYGVSKDRFLEVFSSKKILNRVNQAEALTKEFSLASVPEFIVAGKYRVDPMRAGGSDDIFKVINFLVNKEANARKDTVIRK